MKLKLSMSSWAPTSLALAITMLLPMAVAAQTAQTSGFPVGASVVNTDFQKSWATFEGKGNGKYLVTFRATNKGNLTSKNARLAIVLPDGWGYEGTAEAPDFIQTRERPYGQLVEWQLKPIPEGNTSEIRATLTLPEGMAPSPLFAALTSDFSVPVYAEITSVSSTANQPVWSSWIRSWWSYIGMTLKESWYRVKL